MSNTAKVATEVVEKVQTATMSKLDQVLVTTIEKVSGGIEKGVDFAMKEIPDVIHQLLLWNGVKSFVECLIGIGIWCGVAYFVHQFFVKYRAFRALPIKEQEDDSNYHMTPSQEITIRGLITFIGSIILFLIGGVYINIQWLQIWIAPKIWLIEYASKLMTAH